MRKRILLIMPQMPLADTFCGFLKEMGYTIYVQDNPRFALSSSDQFQPDLIMCYEDFVGMKGSEIAWSLKNTNEMKDIPFLMISPKPLTLETSELRLSDMKIDDLINLPVEQADLYGYVTNWLESDTPVPLSLLRYNEMPEGNVSEKGNGKKKSKTWSKGAVSPYSVGRLFHCLIKKQATGTLLVRGERRKLKACIEEGNIIDVQSNYMRDDTLGRYLMGIGKLTEEQHQASISQAAQDNSKQGAALVELGYFDADQLLACMTEHKLIKLLNLFQRRWYKSKFVFNEGPIEHRARDFHTTPLQRVISMGILNIARKKDLYETFYRKNKECSKLCICEDFDRLAQDLDLGPALVNQAMELNGSSLEEIKSCRADLFENNLRLAFLLVVTKGMHFAA